MKNIRCLALTMLLFPFSAGAVVIDFEGVIPQGQTRFGDPIFTYSEDGFDLVDFDSGSANALFAPPGSQNDNGTDILGWVSNRSFDIVKAGGGLFSLNAFDATNLDPIGAAGQFIVTGFLGGGGTVSATLDSVLNTFTTFTFDNSWTGLSAVRIQNTGMVNGAIDNIVLSATNAVPEPATLALLGLAIGGIGCVRRRNA
ncbi:MAG: PEP-CTERM sorting domain-containing protein [Gammaproteobacteria bacterium]